MIFNGGVGSKNPFIGGGGDKNHSSPKKAEGVIIKITPLQKKAKPMYILPLYKTSMKRVRDRLVRINEIFHTYHEKVH